MSEPEDVISLWDVPSGTLLAELKGHAGRISSLAVSPDTPTLASASHDGTVMLLDLESRTSVATLTGHTGSVFSVANAPDGTSMATGSSDGTVRLWRRLPPRVVLPRVVSLLGNFPNPFSGTTQILLNLPSDADVSVDVMDVLGRLVVALPAQNIPGGTERSIAFDGGVLASGLYLYRVSVTTSEGSEVHMGSFVRAK